MGMQSGCLTIPTKPVSPKRSSVSEYLPVLFGLGLAATVLTSQRLQGALGIGEALLVVGILWATLSPIGWGRGTDLKVGLPYLFGLIILFVLVPVTILSHENIPNLTKIRDILAYALCAVVAMAIPKDIKSLRILSRSYIFFLILIALSEYIIAGDNSHYYSRFTAGAHNPNQFALLVAVCVCLVYTAELPVWLLPPVIIILFFLGVQTRSDALTVFMVLAAVGFIGTILLPRKHRYLALFVLLIAAIFIFLFDTLNVAQASALWSRADEGGVRTALYANGIAAWLDTPVSVLVGHGAGAFSGVSAPFQGAEAHNTPIDFLTICGIPGAMIGTVIPVGIAVSLLHRRAFVASVLLVSLVCFSFFHFVGRQPAYWVALTLFAVIAKHRPLTKEKICVRN